MQLNQSDLGIKLSIYKSLFLTSNKSYIPQVGLDGGAMVSAATSQHKCSGFEPAGCLGSFFVEIACSLCVGFLKVL